MDTDRKIALLIAGGVLLAFAVIAVLTTSVSTDEPEILPTTSLATLEPANRLASPPVEPVALPGEAQVSAGTPEEAEAFQVEPGVNYLARGLEAYAERNWEHAVAYLLAEAEEHPERPYSRYLLGLSLWKAGRLDEASEAMQRAVELDGTAVKAFINLSRIENDRGEFGAALEAARSALALSPDDATALFLEGRSLRNLSDTTAAVASLERSLEVDPDNGYVWNLLGLIHLEQERTPDALEALSRAAELEPEVAYIHNNRGMALERSGQRDEAVAAYRRAAELDPDHPHAPRNLARLDPPPATLPEESPDALAQSNPEVPEDEHE
jgi:tetratricopeptide (TPR) repeat protein